MQTPASLVGRNQSRKKWQPLKLDGTIALISFIFVLTGLLFTYSSSAFETTQYVKRQLIFDIAGLIAAGFLSQMYTRIQRMKIFRPINLLMITWVLLIIVLFTREQANTHRWIDLGFIKIQPSEIAKVTLVIYIADCLDKVSGKLAKNWRAMIHPIIMAGITILLVLAEKDLGIPALMGVVFLAMLFVAGAKWWHVAGMGGMAVVAGVVQMLVVPYRRARLFSFLHIGNYTDNSTNYQVMQSFMAVGSGGWLGKGLGNSELKMQYLPAAHTDFIFSVMCEEDVMNAYFDCDKVDKILYNLLSNSAKYSNTNGYILLTLKYLPERDHVQLSVKDNGKGISKERQKDLFTRFYEGDYRQKHTIGTGIGLSIVKTIIDRHNATISVESAIGKGTSFHIVMKAAVY